MLGASVNWSSAMVLTGLQFIGNMADDQSTASTEVAQGTEELRQEVEDLKELVASSQFMLKGFIQDPAVGAAATFYQWRLRQIPGQGEINDERMQAMADAMGVDKAVLEGANAEALKDYPRYGVQPGDPAFVGRRVPRPNPTGVSAKFLKEKTIRVSPKLAKSAQRVIASNMEFFASGMQNANGRRVRGTEVRETDVFNYGMQNTMEALNHSRKRKAKQAFNGAVNSRPRKRGNNNNNENNAVP